MKTTADVITVSLTQGSQVGCGECVPYGRYGETLQSVQKQIEAAREAVEFGCTRTDLQEILPAGAARNAIDCALWDLEARRKSHFVPYPKDAIETAQTIVIDTNDGMARAAYYYRNYPILKVKLDDQAIVERIRLIREQAPKPKLVIDANESWDIALLQVVAPQLVPFDIALLEQPLPREKDAELRGWERPIPLCADESCHTSADLERLSPCYDAVNIKLDKTGGLTEAWALYEKARGMGFKIMFGCMVSTSRSIYPALPIAGLADFVDLDGPTWLEKDRDNGLIFDVGKITPPQRGVRGGA